jgi:uncharacterized protein YcsI (UPF0317 family)
MRSRSTWRDDLVSFLLGCSLTFEQRLLDADVPIRHLEAGTDCPVYVTSVQCKPAGPFQGPLVVSMRPIPAGLVDTAIDVTRTVPEGHGAPVWAGDPAELGISDLNTPSFGSPPVMRDGDVPVFWACGVTPQFAAADAEIDLMISHSPAHMFVSDRRI